MPPDEFEFLDEATAAAVEAILAESSQTGSHVCKPYERGDIYAYPHPDGGIAWGVNNPINVLRGVRR